MKLAKKCRKTGGFTLLEVVVTMLMVSLIGISVAGGVAASARAYKDIVSVSESQLLASTLLKSIENELRYAENISGSGENVTFYSNKYGSSCSFKTIYDASTVITPGTNPEDITEEARKKDAPNGQISLGYDADGHPLPLVGSGAYSTGTNQRKSAGVKVSWDESLKVFHVELNIYLGVHDVENESASVLEASLLKKEELTITPLKYI